MEKRAGRIPPVTLENLFNPFSERNNDDTRLDLAMSQKIIEDHGGDIKIISKAEMGTTVIFELPLG